MPFSHESITGATIKSRISKLNLKSPEELIDFPSTHRFLWKSPGHKNISLSLGKSLKIETNGLSRVTDVLNRLDQISFETQLEDTSLEPPTGTTARFVGNLSYYPHSEIGAPWNEKPSAYFILPRVQILKNDKSTWLTINSVEENINREEIDTLRQRLDRFQSNNEATATLSQNEILNEICNPCNQVWKDTVDDLRTNCRYGSIQKIVPAQHRQLELKRPVTLPELYKNFTVDNPKTFRFIQQKRSSGVFVGASPERLLSLQGKHFETESIAGTTQSGESDVLQQSLADELSESEKDLKEHDHVVEYLRDKLAPLVSSIEMVPRSVRNFNKVQHLVTAITGNLKSECHILELTEKLHPTPAVCGRPAGLALDKLNESEDFDRGNYGAPIGWFDQNGNGEFSVAIRSALIRGNEAHTFAGAGIIADSDPEDELQELQLKFESIYAYLLGSGS